MIIVMVIYMVILRVMHDFMDVLGRPQGSYPGNVTHTQTDEQADSGEIYTAAISGHYEPFILAPAEGC